MDGKLSLPRLVASSLLGVIAVAAFVFGVLLFLAAWATGSTVGGWVGQVGTVAVVIIGVLALAYALLAALAARQEWLGHPAGRVLGLIVALVAVLAAVTTLLVGNVEESVVLLYIAAGLGIVTAIPLVIPETGPARA